MIYGLFTVKNYQIKNNQLIVKRILGFYQKNIPLKDIKYYIITEIGKYKTEERLIIFTEYEHCSLTSSVTNNYYLIKSYITAGKSRNTYLEQLKVYRENKCLSIFLAIVSISLFVLAIYVFHNKGKEISHQQLSFIQLTVKEISKERNGKRSNSIIIHSTEYPNLFIISGIAYYITDTKVLLENVQKGSPVVISVLKQDYQKKISKKALSLWDKLMTHSAVDIIEIQDKNRSYLSLEDVNRKRDNHYTALFWIAIAFALGITAFNYKMFKSNTKPVSKTRHNQLNQS